MKKIESLTHTAQDCVHDFTQSVFKHVNAMQEKGLEVEIQYVSTGPTHYSALILGRREGCANEA